MSELSSPGKESTDKPVFPEVIERRRRRITVLLVLKGFEALLDRF